MKIDHHGAQKGYNCTLTLLWRSCCGAMMNEIEDTPNPVAPAEDGDVATGATEEPVASEVYAQSDVAAVLARFSVAPTK